MSRGKMLMILFLVMGLIPMTALWSTPAVQTVPQVQRPAEQTFLPSAGKEDARTSAPAIYEGAPECFRILDKGSGKVLDIPVQEFARGAVAAEMPARFHPEALKAQAAAACSYAMRLAAQQKLHPDPALQGADFAADPENLRVWISEEKAREFYGENFDLYWNKVCRAADEGGQYVVLYEGEPAAAAYHAISAGQTEDAAYLWKGEPLPYLAAVPSEGDLLAAGYESEETFGTQQMREKLTDACPDLILPEDPAKWLAVTEKSPSGYVTEVQTGNLVLTGQRLRNILGLRSSHFTVEGGQNGFVFHVQGYGHGAGLSQNGADYMARQGASFDEILLHYYPGTTLAMTGRKNPPSGE